MYLNQCSLTGGILFVVTLMKAANSINMDMMTVDVFHAKLQKSYDDIEAGKVQNAASALTKFREST